MDQSSSEPCGVGDHNGVQGLKSLQISSDSTNNNAEAWKRWWQQLELYLLATGLDKAPEKRKIAILLHLIGEKGLNIFNTFNLTIEKTTLAEVKSKFQNFFEPRRNITMCRHMFFTRKQQKSESIEGFLADLENKSQDCEFGTLRESLIRDIFIANLHMDLAHVRQRLLQEPDLTYQKMRELARTLIVAQQDAEKIVSSSNVEKSENVRRRSRSRGDRRQRASPVGQQGSGAGKSPNPERRSRTCSRCGQSHRYKCPAQGVKCRSCKSFGHFAKYCFKNKNISHLESFNSSHSHNNNQDYFVGILNSHSSSQSHKSNCHLKSYNSHYKHVKSASTQSPPPQFTYIHSQSQSGNDSGDDIGVIPERSHRDSYCQYEKLILKSYFKDDNGDNVMSERSEKYLGDESSHQSEKSILKSYCHNSNKSCDSQSVYLNDEYRHMSEESPHTITTVTSPYHSQQVTSSFSQVNTVESKHKHNINNSKQSWNINVKVGHSQFNCIH
ncbi:uncharacterized protein LOC110374139 [Helicoverpa armigera]|uniref:uncharacterized protein LOC110374139 n=1 Tax=Helicoverpa armigera TaxID=29058 RepID=UPI003082C278